MTTTALKDVHVWFKNNNEHFKPILEPFGSNLTRYDGHSKNHMEKLLQNLNSSGVIKSYHVLPQSFYEVS